jgi:hypothetical protein
MTARRFPPPWSVEELDACFAIPALITQEAGAKEKPSLLTYLKAGSLARAYGAHHAHRPPHHRRPVEPAYDDRGRAAGKQR